MQLRPAYALVLSLALLPACAAPGPHEPKTEIVIAENAKPEPPKVDPDPERVSTGGKVALGVAGASAVGVVVAIVAVGVASAALMSNMSGP